MNAINGKIAGTRSGGGNAAAPGSAKWGAVPLGAADWLYLAAAPTFAVMALMTGLLGGGPLDAICSAGHDSPLGGMVPMYLLMSVFHLAPWLKLISSRGNGTP